jgi:hypothetical protein
MGGPEAAFGLTESERVAPLVINRLVHHAHLHRCPGSLATAYGAQEAVCAIDDRSIARMARCRGRAAIMPALSIKQSAGPA